MEDHTEGRGDSTPSWPDPCTASPPTGADTPTAPQEPVTFPVVKTIEPQLKKRTRRLKPEIAAKFAAVRTAERLQQLYDRPVAELSPEELAQMRAAFFRRD